MPQNPRRDGFRIGDAETVALAAQMLGQCLAG
jgi:hypothetical protein